MEENEQIELLPLYAYEEFPPRIKTKAEILAEKLERLKKFDFPPPEQPENDSTGRMAFLHASKKIDKLFFFKYPLNSIATDLSSLDSETLDLSYAGLKVKGCVALAAALRVNTSVSNLVLVGNFITPEGGMALAKGISEARSVSSIDFSENSLGCIDVNSNAGPTIRGGHVINELLNPTNPVNTLYLRQNGLTDEDVSIFSGTLADNVTLQDLDLSFNNIKALGATILSRVLGRNADIHRLNMESNPLSTAGAECILKHGVLLNNTLRMINFSGCGIGRSGAATIGLIITENSIEEIIIANNKIDATGAAAIAKGLGNTSSLTKLVLDGNPLGDAGCSILFNAADATSESTFHYLSLLHCQASKTVCEDLRNAQMKNTALTFLISEGLSKVGHDF